MASPTNPLPSKMFAVVNSKNEVVSTHFTLTEASRERSYKNLSVRNQDVDHEDYDVKMIGDWMSEAAFGTAEHSLSL